MQIATLPISHDITNGRNYKGEKFLTHSMKLLEVADDDYRAEIGRNWPIIELAELCVWTGISQNASRYYATLWVHSNPYFISGHGMAGGYGYCKSSAASGGAFRSAGITLSENIHGAGMYTVELAMYALGAALGFCKKKLYVVRGV